jgi:hypothetical protein
MKPHGEVLRSQSRSGTHGEVKIVYGTGTRAPTRTIWYFGLLYKLSKIKLFMNLFKLIAAFLS